MAKKEDKQQAEARSHKILDFIDKLDAQDLNNELKIRKLLVMGSTKEKKERLKKAMETSADPFNVSDPKNDPKIKKKKEAPTEIKKSSIVSKIEEMNKKREERRKKMDNDKKTRQANQAQFEADGKTGDIDFAMMIDNIRSSLPKPIGHLSPEGLKIIVSVRKRPLFTKEKEAGENDCITCANPKMYIHECKLRVDGITKYVDNQSFAFDNAFSEKDETTEFYRYSIQPLIPLLYTKGTVTCFAYGQTGSGKTYTMVSAQKSAIEDLFSNQPTSMELSYSMSYFEIYGNKLYDLLNERNPLIVLEDKNQIIQIQGLSEKPAVDPEDMMKLMEKANALRTTHATTANDTSSRSHSICHILIKDKKTMKLVGKLSLVDLAGSERAQDCQSNDRVRRLEGAEINKSLLALKECIRGLDTKDAHIPFRASKLTMVLRDSFVGKSDKIRIVMIACISPGSSSADHTLNTLRYAERLKERTNIDYEEMVNKQNEESSKNDESKEEIVVKEVENKEGETKESDEHEQNEINAGHEEVKEECDINSEEDVANEESGAHSKEESSKDVDEKECEKIVLENWAVDVDKIEYQKKADEIMEEEQAILNEHISCIEKDAFVLNEETELLNDIQCSGDYDLMQYIQQMEQIVDKKKSCISLMEKRIASLKDKLIEEESLYERTSIKKNIN